MTKGFPLWLLLAALLALGLRSIQLDSRPMHNDEAVNAIKFRNLWEGAGYRYDPKRIPRPHPRLLHPRLGKTDPGPGISPASPKAACAPSPFSSASAWCLLLFLVSDGLGRNATLAAALLTAVSPVMVYYSRDYIHETLFVFFIFLALAAGWRYCQTGKIAWILLAGAATRR